MYHTFLFLNFLFIVSHEYIFMIIKLEYDIYVEKMGTWGQWTGRTYKWIGLRVGSKVLRCSS